MGEEGTGNESHRDEIVAVRGGGRRRVRKGRMGIEERGKVVEGEGGVVGVIEWVGVEVEDGFTVSGGGDGDHRFW